MPGASQLLTVICVWTVVCAQEKRQSAREHRTHLAVKYRDTKALTNKVRGCSER